jgi:hypothetical protein
MSHDPYLYFPGQAGHNMKKCVSFDEVNRQCMLQKMVLRQTNEPQEIPPVDNYMSIDDPISKRILSCQNITPTYYPNMTLNMIGKRPVYSSRQCEYHIPDIILKNKNQLMNRNFTCLQPYWQWDCM